MNTIFCSPLRYTQGAHATQSLGAEMKVLGLRGHVLIVASASPRKLLENIWRDSLTQTGYAFSIHDFARECTAAEIASIAATARAAKSAIIVGAGGGKVLDASRAAAAELELPFICCPTIASTDSPTCAISVVYNEQGVVETALIHPRNPMLILVDTHVIANAPVRTFVAGMGDALSTYFEARACMRSNKPNMCGGARSLTSMAIAELCYKTLLADGVAALRAAKEKTITPALERVIEANILLSGLGFESAGLAGAHSVHNGLTVVPGAKAYMHGEKVAFGVIAQLMLEKSDPAQINQVIAFCKSVGLPTTLADIGCANLSQDMLAKVAARATIASEFVHNEPFPVTANMVAEAIMAADAAGR